jgi:hypothetical protein
LTWILIQMKIYFSATDERTTETILILADIYRASISIRTLRINKAGLENIYPRILS